MNLIKIIKEGLKKIISLFFSIPIFKNKIAKIIIAIALLTIIGYEIIVSNEIFSISSKIDSDNEKNFETFPAKIITVKGTSVIPSISVLGVIEYFEKINITAKTSGRIGKIFIDEGQKVKKNQALVELEKLPLELELKKNKAELQEAKSACELSRQKLANKRKEVEINLHQIIKLRSKAKELKAKLKKIRDTFEGKKKLYEVEGISKEEYDIVKTDLISSEAQYFAALKDLDIASVGYRDKDLLKQGYDIPKEKKEKFEQLVDLNSKMERAELEMAESRVKSAGAILHSTEILLKECTIRSPINGVVAMRNKNVGEQVSGGSAENPSEAILVLVDINKVYAKIDIRESEITHIDDEQEIKLNVDSFPDKVFTGIITRINPIIDPKTHTSQVRALIKNPDHILKPGMFVRSKIDIGKPYSAYMVPTNAILPKKGNKGWLFIIKDARVYKVEVTIGKEAEKNTEILSGLKNGDQVAIEKLSQLRDGLKITPIVTIL